MGTTVSATAPAATRTDECDADDSCANCAACKAAREAESNYDLALERYTEALRSGRISLQALERIIRHDATAGGSATPGGTARIRAHANAVLGLVPHRVADEPGDELYGIRYPLPLAFPSV